MIKFFVLALPCCFFNASLSNAEPLTNPCKESSDNIAPVVRRGITVEEIPSLELKPFEKFFIQTDIQASGPLGKALAERLAAAAVAAGVPEARVKTLMTNFQIGFHEVYSNAVKHAHRHDRAKNIRIRFGQLHNRFVLEVADWSGSFFDPRDMNDPRNHRRFVNPDEMFTQIDEVQERRRQSGHDPDRPEGDGGRGIVMTDGGLADSLFYAPNNEGAGGGRSVAGTRVIAVWNF